MFKSKPASLMAGPSRAASDTNPPTQPRINLASPPSRELLEGSHVRTNYSGKIWDGAAQCEELKMERGPKGFKSDMPAPFPFQPHLIDRSGPDWASHTQRQRQFSNPGDPAVQVAFIPARSRSQGRSDQSQAQPPHMDFATMSQLQQRPPPRRLRSRKVDGRPGESSSPTGYGSTDSDSFEDDNSKMLPYLSVIFPADGDAHNHRRFGGLDQTVVGQPVVDDPQGWGYQVEPGQVGLAHPLRPFYQAAANPQGVGICSSNDAHMGVQDQNQQHSYFQHPHPTIGEWFPANPSNHIRPGGAWGPVYATAGHSASATPFTSNAASFIPNKTQSHHPGYISPPQAEWAAPPLRANQNTYYPHPNTVNSSPAWGVGRIMPPPASYGSLPPHIGLQNGPPFYPWSFYPGGSFVSDGELEEIGGAGTKSTRRHPGDVVEGHVDNLSAHKEQLTTKCKGQETSGHRDKQGETGSEQRKQGEQSERKRHKVAPSHERYREHVINGTASEIGSSMSTADIITHLVKRGCEDLTNSVDLATFGEYPVSNGGFSDVYRGFLTDRTLVAIKALRVSTSSLSQDSKHLKRAARELHTWGKCRHPNVLPLLGLAIFRDRIGMISPWMKKGSLTRYLEQVPGINRHNICTQICEGLSYLHEIGIIHGDLKGANILVSYKGVPVLTDFGNALLAHRTLKFTQTTSNSSLTIRWAAAELIAESGEPSKASDIYALGMTIYEAMTGQVPYYGKSETSIIYLVAVQKTPPERPTTMHGTHEGDELWNLLLRCCSFEPSARPSSAEVTKVMKTMA